MARAKHTDRADARRRYRATQLAPTSPGEGAEDEEGDTEAASGSGGPSSKPATRSRSLFGSLDMHWPNVPADLAAAPGVLRNTPLLWLAFAIGVAGVVAAALVPVSSDAAKPLPTDPLPALGVQLLIQFPTAALVGGFGAPRAAYLFGVPLGLLQGIALTLLLTRIAAAQGAALPPDVIAINGAYAVVQGVLFAAIASWYRRWLRTMSARNAAARAAREKQQRRDAKRPARGTRPVR